MPAEAITGPGGAPVRPRRAAGRPRRWPAGLLVFLLAAGPAGPARAQISPGPLSRAHEDLEGPRRCKQCHGSKAEKMDAACTSCHGEIAKLLEDRRGFHAGVGETPCGSCHPEHAGRDFELISWKEGGPEEFDHGSAGWPLDGRHARVSCRDCHQAKFQSGPLVPLIRQRPVGSSWLGLMARCAGCHEDVHRGTLSTECGSCHGTAAWKPAAGFDHARSAFPLTGKHATVSCEACHVPRDAVATASGPPAKPVAWKPLTHAECSPCHRDPHAGSLGPTCSGCHTTLDFRRIDPGSFRHELTRFPLSGAHASAPCAACHDPEKAWGKKPPLSPCGACHGDAHAGTAQLAGKPADCAACHSTAAFSPSTFTAALHRDTAYPLEGKHAAAPCRSCHPKSAEPALGFGSAGIRLHPAFGACRDCHGPAHGTQLAAREGGDACEGCHTVAGWRPSTFTALQHASLALPLESRHAEVECRACHGPDRSPLPPPEVRGEPGSAGVFLGLLDTGCVACHVDAHRGRWAPAWTATLPSTSRGPAAASGAAGDTEPRDCRECHDSRSFHPATVDLARHGTFPFPLEGAHRAIPCQGCHPELEHRPAASTLLGNAAGVPDLPFDRERARCRDCHQDPHGGQFSGPLGKECDACHGAERFRPATRFDHDRDAAFPLRGAHERVACARCHPSGTGPEGAPVVLYRPLDRSCLSCHGAGPEPPPAGGGRSDRSPERRSR